MLEIPSALLFSSVLLASSPPQADNFFTRPSIPSRNEIHAFGSKGLSFIMEVGSVRIALEIVLES